MNVLDASALLAFLFREPGYAAVESVASDCCISTVNLAEVLSRFSRDDHNPRAAYRQIESSAIEIVPFVGEHAVLTAALAPHTKSLGLSLDDRACLALAMSRECAVLTADRIWSELSLPVEIIQIRDETAS